MKSSKYLSYSHVVSNLTSQIYVLKKKNYCRSTRHSRFGGTFSVANVKSISDKSLIYHRPLTSMDNLNFDKNKRPVKLARNRRTPDDPEANKRRSTLAIRLFLKEFCVEFLHAGKF